MTLDQQLDDLIEAAECAIVQLREDGRLNNADELDGALEPFRPNTLPRAKSAVEQMQRPTRAGDILRSAAHAIREAAAAYRRARL
jgi:hypothetical protein